MSPLLQMMWGKNAAATEAASHGIFRMSVDIYIDIFILL